MLSFLTAVPSGSLVVILAMDAVDHWSGNKNIGNNLKTYMSSEFGATQFSSLTFRESYGLIGYKGESSPLAEDVKIAGSGSVTLSVIVPCFVGGPTISPVFHPSSTPMEDPVPAPTTSPVLHPTPSPIGQPVSAPSQACADVNFVGTSKGFSDGNEASLTSSDGFDDSWTGRGFNVISFSDITNTLLSQQTFDTYSSEVESNSMLSFLTAVPSGSLVVILAMDAVDHWSGNKNIGNNLKTYMSSEFGATQFSSLTFRESYGLIGFKGESSPLAEDSKASGTGFVAVTATASCS